jgi:cellulose biosynthesis protein BcsQ
VRSIVVVNLMGGSGKTTTPLTLAVGAAMRNLRVLLIEGDPQADASMTIESKVRARRAGGWPWAVASETLGRSRDKHAGPTPHGRAPNQEIAP